jgi:hypothetical protein
MSGVDSRGRTIFAVDAHRGGNQRFIVRADERLTPIAIIWSVESAERPKLSDPAHEGVRLQPGRDGRVRCSAWLDSLVRHDWGFGP